MKKVVYIAFLLITFFIMTTNIEAKSYYVRVVDINGWADLHTAAGNNSWTDTFYAGKILELLDTDKYSTNWYNVKDPDTNKSGWVTSNYAIPYVDYETNTNIATTTCEIEMDEAGFPSSYWPYLCFMKEQHPNWEFRAIDTGLKWQDVINAESACRKNLFYTSNSKYIDSTCDYGYSGWESPTKEAVAYYMDPRNFLGENFVFQFDYLKYDDALATDYYNFAVSTFTGTSFYNYHVGNGLDFAQLLVDAGEAQDVSPTFLASRIRQELGTGTSLYNLYSGKTTDYIGYYNFYNIGVSDDCVKQYGTTKCGLSYAANHGWKGVSEALEGGAEFLSTEYISVGQYTTYLQKYNVVPVTASDRYLNQYMTNIQAPMQEAKSTYANLKSTNYLNKSYAFYIPVYDDMDVILDNTGSGATGEDPNNELVELPVSTIVTESGYKYTSTTISKIEIGTDVSDIKGTLEGGAGHGNVTIMDKDENVKTKGALATGDKITIRTADETKVLTVVVYGDTSGDGIVNALDLLQVQKQILGTYDLKSVYNTAGDTSKDGKIDALDLLQVQKQILKTYTIEQ